MGLQMTTTEALQSKSAFNAAVGLVTGNPWVETAWMALEAASDLDDQVTIDACLRVIDDDGDGNLPWQSDMNIVFGFMNAHMH
jgi:hypothetical protein